MDKTENVLEKLREWKTRFQKFWRRSGRTWTFRVAVIFAGLFVIFFPIYLWTIYVQLEKAFTTQREFIPTRVYSDIIRIAPPQTRRFVQSRLKALGYKFELQEDVLEFKLHDIVYPDYLLPDIEGEPHPFLIKREEILDRPIQLIFDGPDDKALLQSIEVVSDEIEEIYLEPELVATLGGSGEGSSQIRKYLTFEDIPSPVWKAIMAVEDPHYLEHKGIDPRGFLRALWVNLKSFALKQGGSTITQQLVKNLLARRTKNIFKKFNELFLSIILEFRFEKEQILERYLNELYLGQIGNHEVHGIYEGAQYFYGKKIGELNLAEIALMAGIIRGPSYYSPYRHFDRAIRRQKFVLKKMVENGHIAEDEMIDATAQPIRLVPPPTARNKAPYFTDYVKAQLIDRLLERMSEEEISQAGFRVYTTLNTYLNSRAQEAVARGVKRLEKRFGINQGKEKEDGKISKEALTDTKTEEENEKALLSKLKLQGALASVDHRTGFIRVLIGGESYRRSTFNRILNMKRQVGSTFKPIVFLAALEEGRDNEGVPFGPGYPVHDAPWTLTFDEGRQTWSPKNYVKEFHGWTSLRTAVSNSINIPFAKLGQKIGIERVIETAEDLGISTELPNVPSLALGVVELSPVELLRVYAIIANHGIQDELTVIRAITHDDGTPYAHFVYEPKMVIDAARSDLVIDVLQSVFSEGTARHAFQLGFERAAAGKTGTTSNHRDAWFAGFTPELTTVSWVGLDRGILLDKEGDAKIHLTGGGSALPIWVDYMKKALESVPPRAFPVSEHLENVKIDRKSGYLAPSDCPDEQIIVERYISGTEAPEEECATDWPWPEPTETPLPGTSPSPGETESPLGTVPSPGTN